MQQVSLEATITQWQPLSRSSNCYKELVNSICIIIAKDMHPLSVVESDGFKSLMKLAVPRFAITSRKHFSQSVIPCLYLQFRTRIETILRQAEYCSFMTDLWAAKYKNCSYIGLTCHFIDQEWELHSYCMEHMSFLLITPLNCLTLSAIDRLE